MSNKKDRMWRVKPADDSVEFEPTEATTADVDYIISMRVSDTLLVVTGSKQLPCSLCGNAAWASPATLTVFGDPPSKPLVCMQCATHIIKEEKH